MALDLETRMAPPRRDSRTRPSILNRGSAPYGLRHNEGPVALAYSFLQ